MSIAGGKWLFGVCVAGCAVAVGCTEPVQQPVVLVVVDTLRADHLGTYGYALPTSPALDDLAASGLVFDNAFSTSSWTLPAFGSIYTGQYPARHQAGASIRDADEIAAAGGADPQLPARRQRFSGLVEGVPTLAETFAAQGFLTGAVISNPFLHESFGLARGFSTYDYATGRRADAVVDAAFEWIDRAEEEPLFLVVHFMDPHLPYAAPAEYRGRFTSSEPRSVDYPIRKVHDIRAQLGELDAADWRFITGAYDEEIAYLDDQLGRFFDGLRRRGILDNGIVVLTSDHGEELLDHGGFEHGHSMYNEVVRVPLVVWGPDVVPGRVDEPVTLADLMPTLLDASGIEPPAAMAGVSLADHLQGRARRTERGLVLEGNLGNRDLRAVVMWPNKVVFDANGAVALFDLAADPREVNDLSAADERAWAALVSTAEMLFEAPSTALQTMDLDPALVEQLRNLGYLR